MGASGLRIAMDEWDNEGGTIPTQDRVLRDYDEVSYDRMRETFAYWDDIHTYFKGRKIVSRGHDFCGMSRKELLLLLHGHRWG